MSDRVSYGGAAPVQHRHRCGAGRASFKEPAPGMRIGASLVIIAGMLCIALGG
ncbi:MAG: hypothetical protein R2838_18990 [Caldilineaceae bacterium]